ncbi:MAG TPA: chaperone modulator CbpM [Burkholderiaceae bacterium]|nr:chaperone modulator CbpM [Burkholderiaceae bacterium]
MSTPRPHVQSTACVVEEHLEFGIDELGRVCRCQREWIAALVHEGVLHPIDPRAEQLRFRGDSLQRARRAVRLMRDLDLNPPGVALALELLDRVEQLELRLRILKTR